MTKDSALQGWDIVSGVGITALAVTAARAVETDRDDALIQDPFAEAFVRAAERPPIQFPTRLSEATILADERGREQVDRSVGIRSRFFDEYLRSAWQTGIRQAVLLAAGLDARAFRLEWPTKCTVYELDQPRVLQFKDQVLAKNKSKPRCSRRILACDLRNAWSDALLENGFDNSQPTAWLAEGLLPYLSSSAKRQLLDTIHKLSVPGSKLSFDNLNITPEILESAQKRSRPPGSIDLSELLFPITPDDDPSAHIAARGWDVVRFSGSELIELYRPELGSYTYPRGASPELYYIVTFTMRNN